MDESALVAHQAGGGGVDPIQIEKAGRLGVQLALHAFELCMPAKLALELTALDLVPNRFL